MISSAQNAAMLFCARLAPQLAFDYATRLIINAHKRDQDSARIVRLCESGLAEMQAMILALFPPDARGIDIDMDAQRGAGKADRFLEVACTMLVKVY